MTRGRTTRVIIVSVLAITALVIGSVVWALSPASPPDVAAQANVPAARNADRLVVAEINGQLTRLRAQLPRAEQLGTSVVDLCRSQPTSGSFAPWRPWRPVSCQRTTTLYLGFDGELQGRLTELDRVIDGLGWQPSAPEQRGLVAQARYLHSTNVTVDFARRPAGTTRLSVEVGRVPFDPILPDNWDDWPIGHPSDAKPYQNDDLDQVVYFVWQPVNAAELTRTTQRSYVAAFDFDATYYTQPQPAQAPTTTHPAPPYGSICRSGSNKCN